MKVKCPRCKQETEYEVTNKHRPFCSERCQMIDLGQWAEGRYAIPVTDPNELDEEHIEAAENLSPSGDSDKIIH